MSNTSPSPADPHRLPLEGLRIVCFESRRSAESSRMIARQGGVPIEAPALREVPLRGPSGLDALEADLGAKKPLLLILLTGVGTELMLEGLRQNLTPERALALLTQSSTSLVCRGPKPHAVLKQRGIKPAVVVGEPNTWRDVLHELDAHQLIAGRHVYVQEYGRTNEDLMRGIAERDPISVRQVKTYEWALPEDLSPLKSAIARICSGDADVALFTSGVQVTHLFRVAAQVDQLDPLRAALGRVVVASVGPLTTEVLRASGISPDLEPEHPKLGHLMVALAIQAKALLAAKRPAPHS